MVEIYPIKNLLVISFFFVCLGIDCSYAQLGFCGGNSGDPIFTEDFGTGTVNNPLPAGTTTYAYDPGFPDDGFYTVSNGTFGNVFDWHQTTDHTPGDTNGKCLIVNAGIAAGEFYRTTVSGLCESTTYEFSAWLMNLVIAGSFCSTQPSGTIPINVSFEIWDGTDTNLLASGDTGNIFETSSPDWQEYGLVFQTLAGQNTVILKMINNGQGGCGNDLAIDDIEFKSCGDLVDVIDPMGNNSFVDCEDTMVTDVLLTAVPDFAVFSSHFYQWQFSTDMIVWNDIPGETNPTYNAPTTTGTFFYRTKFSEFAATLNNDSCNSFSEIYELRIDALATPIFDPVGPICEGDALANLPTTSNNGITGIWTPAVNNTVTTTYTFTPDPGQCATTQSLTIVVDPNVTPVFDPVPDICSGDTLANLPTTSNNGIIGSWSPAIDNTMTTTYTFTPDAGQCAVDQTLTIVVNPISTPSFDPVAPICEGDTLAPLPTISNNGITGSWTPALDNTTTTTYTFTPDAGQCASSQTLTITVNPILSPDFDAVPDICSGDFLADLPTTSNNGISGSWTPAIDNTATTTYTFTPDPGECATTQTLTIVVNQAITPTFDPVPAVCAGDFLADLPTTSNNGVTGSWTPALDNTTTTTYTFTPDAGLCQITASLTVVVHPATIVDLEDSYPLCLSADGMNVIQSPVISTGLPAAGFSFEWRDSGGTLVGTDAFFIPTDAGTYSVTAVNNVTGCQGNDTTVVEVSSPPIVQATVVSDPFSDTNIIEVTVSGSGDYEYSIDNGPWQDDPIFTGVSAGTHIISARDKNGCGTDSISLCVIGYPKFFTPNGDSYNDTWNIREATCLLESRVYIYDRYGKLLKELGQNSFGWDGTFNGEFMPTSDYWFLIEYRDNNDTMKEFRGHFALKR